MSNKHHDRPAQAGAGQASTPEPAAAPEGDRAVPGLEPQTAELEALRARVAELEAGLARAGEETSSLKDQYLRSLADYENFRKRMFREREDQQKYANFGLLTDLVPLLDDFDRAIASAEHARDYQTLHDGIAIIRRQIASVLENKYGLSRYESLGKPFDPHIHEAVASEPGEVEEPEVSQEYLPGYKLHDRVVRSAKVRVRMPAPSAPARPTASTNPSDSSALGSGSEAPAPGSGADPAGDAAK